MGIDNQLIQDIPLVRAGGVMPTKSGNVIVIMNNYTYVPHHSTIHSSIQLEASGKIVHDKFMRTPGGSQCIITRTGLTHPIDIRNGLAYIPIHPFTDVEA